MRCCSASVVTPPMLRAKSGLNSTAMRKPTKYMTKPTSIKATDTPAVAMMTLRAVMEMERTVPVGPDTHMNCMNGT